MWDPVFKDLTALFRHEELESKFYTCHISQCSHFFKEGELPNLSSWQNIPHRHNRWNITLSRPLPLHRLWRLIHGGFPPASGIRIFTCEQRQVFWGGWPSFVSEVASIALLILWWSTWARRDPKRYLRRSSSERPARRMATSLPPSWQVWGL